MDSRSLSRIAFEHHGDEVRHSRTEVRWKRSVLALDDFLGKLMERASVERRLQGSHLVEEHAKRPNVRLEAVALALDDFGREVIRGADHSLCLGARI